MLNIEAPAQLILTLQSVPPFIIESIFALALTVLLAVPLITQIQLFFDQTLKKCKALRPDVNLSDNEMRPNAPLVVMHYPAPVPFGIESSSSSIINVSALRTTYSTPALSPRNEECVSTSLGRGKLRPPEHSSSYVATNKELSIVDISSFNYSSYRHKLIEAALRKQYGGNYPPGNVILNSIQLNTIDSSADVRKDENYTHSLFDLIHEHDHPQPPRYKQEMEYLHPLDHFVLRPTEKPITIEKHTETMNTTDDEFTEHSMAQTPSTPSSRPITRRRTSSAGRGSVLSNASSRCPLSRVSSKSPSVRPARDVSSRSLSSESAKRICSNVSYIAPKSQATPKLDRRKQDPAVEFGSGAKSPEVQVSATKATKKTIRPHSPDPPGTPDSCIEPIPKKLKVTRRLTAEKSIPEDRSKMSVIDPRREKTSENKVVEPGCPFVQPTALAKPAPVSMIPRPTTKPLADSEQLPLSISETAMMENEHSNISVMKDSIVERGTSLGSDKVISVTAMVARKLQSTKLSAALRRQATPPPAWNNTSKIAKSFNSKLNELALKAGEICGASSKRTITTPRLRNFENQNEIGSWKCGSSPPSGAVSRNSSPSGRPRTANAMGSKRRMPDSLTRISGSRLRTAVTPRKDCTKRPLQEKYGSKVNSEKPITEKCKTSTLKTSTEKSSPNLSTSHEGSSHSRNIMSESSSGVLQSLNSSNSAKCVQQPTMPSNLSPSSSIGTGSARLEEPNKSGRLGKTACRANGTYRGAKPGSAGSYLELAQKRRTLPDKLLIKSLGVARAKITTAPNSRLPSPRSKHSTEFLNALDPTATTLKPAAVMKDVNVTKATSSRAKSEVRNKGRAKSANSDHEKLRDNSIDGEPSLQTLRGREVERGNPRQKSKVDQAKRTNFLNKKIDSSTHSITTVESRSLNQSTQSTSSHRTVNSFEANASEVETGEVKVERGFRNENRSKTRVRPKYGTVSKTPREESIGKTSAAALIGSVFESELPVVDKVESRHEIVVKKPTIRGKSMTSRGLSESREIGKMLRNKSIDKKEIQSLSISTDQLEARQKTSASLGGMEVDSEIIFSSDYPLDLKFHESKYKNSANTIVTSAIEREKLYTHRTRIPSPATTRFLRTPVSNAESKASRHSTSLKSTGNRATLAGSESPESQLSETFCIKTDSPDTAKSDLSKVSRFLKGNSAKPRCSSLLTSYESKRQDGPGDEKIQESMRRSTKAESTIQRSLRNYIKKLKVVLSDENSNTTAEEMASINLTDAILPDMKSVLGSSDLNKLEGLLELAERSTTVISSYKKTRPVNSL